MCDGYKEILMFEYRELREENSRNTFMDYTILTIFFGASFLIFGNYLSYEDPPMDIKLIYASFSLLLAYSALIIDKRLNIFTQERRKKMAGIEEELGIKNIRVAMESEGGKLESDYDKLSRIKDDWISKYIVKIKTSYIFLVLFVVLLILWLTILGILRIGGI